MTRVVKKADERKEELIDIAIELFLAGGYENTTIKDIYTAAGGSFGMFYHHFSSKEEIFAAAMDVYTDRFVRGISIILLDQTAPFTERCRRVFTHWLGLIEGRDKVRGTEHDAYVFRILSEKMLSGAVEPVTRYIEEGIGLGLLHTEDSRRAAIAIVYGIYGMIFEEQKRLGSNEQAAAIFQDALNFVCLILGADEAVFRMEENR